MNTPQPIYMSLLLTPLFYLKTSKLATLYARSAYISPTLGDASSVIGLDMGRTLVVMIRFVPDVGKQPQIMTTMSVPTINGVATAMQITLLRPETVTCGCSKKK